MQITEIREIKKESGESSLKETRQIFCPKCSKPIDRVPYGKSWRLCADEDGTMHVLLISQNEKRIKIDLISE